jgi:hypothetical protein
MRSSVAKFLAPPRAGRLAGWLLSLSLLHGAPGAHAQGPAGPSFEVSAQVTVQDDAARARARALLDAMNQVLEQAVAQAAPEVRGRLYLLSPRARDYILTYRVLEEGESGGQFALRLQAQVDLPRLLRDLQGTVPAGQKTSARRPALQLCTPAADAVAGAAVEQARALLTGRGETVEVLSPGLCAGAIGGSNLAVPGGAPAHAVLALTLEAPSPGEEVRGTLPPRFGALGRASWRVRRLGASSAGSESAISETAELYAFADSAEQAMTQAQQGAAAAALERLLKRPGVLPYSGNAVLVSILGAGSYASYQQLLRVLGALPGVTRAEPRRFVAASPGAGTADDLVQVQVRTSATPESLGAALGRTPLSGLRLQIAPQGPGELRVVCAPGSALPPELPPELPTSSDANEPTALPGTPAPESPAGRPQP